MTNELIKQVKKINRQAALFMVKKVPLLVQRCKLHSTRYANVCKLMNKIGGRKFHNKSYGGGIVFQSYSLDGTIEHIERVKGEMK